MGGGINYGPALSRGVPLLGGGAGGEAVQSRPCPAPGPAPASGWGGAARSGGLAAPPPPPPQCPWGSEALGAWPTHTPPPRFPIPAPTPGLALPEPVPQGAGKGASVRKDGSRGAPSLLQTADLKASWRRQAQLRGFYPSGGAVQGALIPLLFCLHQFRCPHPSGAAPLPQPVHT